MKFYVVRRDTPNNTCVLAEYRSFEDAAAHAEELQQDASFRLFPNYDIVESF